MAASPFDVYAAVCIVVAVLLPLASGTEYCQDSHTTVKECNDCCGEAPDQYCCSGFHFRVSGIAGAVIGILAFLAFIGAIIFCCCKVCNRKNRVRAMPAPTTVISSGGYAPRPGPPYSSGPQTSSSQPPHPFYNYKTQYNNPAFQAQPPPYSNSTAPPPEYNHSSSNNPFYIAGAATASNATTSTKK